MKNVAGYDVSRLLTGSWGSLGLMLDISLKVLPSPVVSCTLMHSDMSQSVVRYLNELGAKDFPVTASCYDGLNVYVRLQGAESAVTAARKRLGGDEVRDGDRFWQKLREQEHSFFQTKNTVWRVAVKSTAPDPAFKGKWLMEWGGALRWYIGNATAEQIRSYAAEHGGHALQFRNPDYQNAVFHPLSGPMKNLHKKIKQVFDPNNVFWSQGLIREI
jgi:glycolate oxidase FAD binding subunit